MQLASYSSSSNARYTPHLDRAEHEVHNKREITILCYANCGWDARRDGGCLRLHPPARGTQKHKAGHDDARHQVEQGVEQGVEEATRAPPWLLRLPKDIREPSDEDGLREASTIDISPTAGRLVLFASREVVHEVLPTTGAERLALTLWVERLGEDSSSAETGE